MTQPNLSTVLFRRLRRGFVSYSAKYRYSQSLHEPIDLALPGAPGLEFQQITHDNVELIREWKGFPTVWRFRTLLSRGYVGLYALTDGKVIGYAWAVARLHPWSLGNSQDVLEVGEAMLGRLEARPEYRWRGVGLYLHIELCKFLRAYYGDRVKRTWGTVLHDNVRMQTLTRYLGFTKSQEMHTVVILGLFYVSRIWNVVPNTDQRIGRGQWFIRVRIPDVFFLPMLKRFRRRVGGYIGRRDVEKQKDVSGADPRPSR